jgi:cytochrome c-type biogenesis protein CcmE
MLKKRNLKFLIGCAVIVAAVTWLAFSGFNQSLAYYKTVDELKSMKGSAYGKRLRVAGNVVPGSIDRSSGTVRFQLEQKGVVLAVNYTGKDILPDTFKDGAQALAEGNMGAGGDFEATKIQAKCASKYEAAAKTGKSY